MEQVEVEAYRERHGEERLGPAGAHGDRNGLGAGAHGYGGESGAGVVRRGEPPIGGCPGVAEGTACVAGLCPVVPDVPAAWVGLTRVGGVLGGTSPGGSVRGRRPYGVGGGRVVP
ncbi:MAG: hypothetical protein ACJ72W_22260 [Actinoallomurus sp.]